MRFGITRLALLACLAVPAVAQAGQASGTLAVSQVGSDQIRLDIFVRHACPDPSSFCGWFPVVVQVAATAPCFHSSPPLWVGDLTESPGEAYTAVEYPYDWYDGAEAIRLCLFLYHESRYEKLAEVVHEPAGGQLPTPPPPPVVVTPPPPPATPVEAPSPAAPRLTLRETRALVRQALKRKFGTRFSPPAGIQAVLLLVDREEGAVPRPLGVREALPLQRDGHDLARPGRRRAVLLPDRDPAQGAEASAARRPGAAGAARLAGLRPELRLSRPGRVRLRLRGRKRRRTALHRSGPRDRERPLRPRP